MLFLNPSLLALSAFAGLGLGASLAQVQNFGGNPTNIQMYIYVPDKVAANPAVIVAVRNPIPQSLILPMRMRL